MNSKFITLFFCYLLLSGCSYTESSNDKSVEGSWQLYDITPKDDSDVDFSTTAKLKKGVKEGSIISLFKDFSYSELQGSGNFKSGKWDIRSNNSIHLIDAKSKTKKVRITSEKNQKGKTFKSLQIEIGDLVFKFIKAAPSLENFKDDPFYGANNLWRIKPAALENPKELNNRMANYFKHLALLLKAVKERKEDIVSFEFSKGPVKIYNGAIGIYPYEIVPQEWKNTFYNDSSAFAAYTLFKNYLETSNYKGAGTGDWIDDDYNILLSIYADFNRSEQ